MESSPHPERRSLAPFASLIWAALFLLLLELALEVRAASRGYRATLLGRGPGVAAQGTAPDPIFGPTPGFPFRSRIVSPEEARSSHALWLASSSYGEDVYMPPGDLFATRLAEALRTPVINASHGGTTVRSNTAELERLGPTYQPAIALLYQMSNDIDLISERLAAGLSAGSAPGAASGSAHALAPISPWIQSMTTYRQLKSHVSSRLAEHLPLWDDLDTHTPKDSPAPEEIFKKDVLAFMEAATRLGAEPVLITFATAYDTETVAEMPPELVRQNLAMNIVLSPEGWTGTIRHFNQTLRELAAEEGLVCIDLAEELRGHPELFRDLWHLTKAGHARVAELLDEALTAEFPELAP